FGSAVVTGAGSLWDHQGGLFVGNGGEGELSILDGGAMDVSGASWIGRHAGSTGEVAVGGGSTLDVGALHVGYEGDGRLDLSGGAMVTSASSTVGAVAGSSGAVTVSTGAMW